MKKKNKGHTIWLYWCYNADAEKSRSFPNMKRARRYAKFLIRTGETGYTEIRKTVETVAISVDTDKVSQ